MGKWIPETGNYLPEAGRETGVWRPEAGNNNS